MRRLRSAHLIVAVLVIALLAHFALELRLRGLLAGEIAFVLAYLFILLNIATAIAGWWTAHRAAWMVYLILSIAGTVLIGAATPINALWQFGMILWG
jgi:hypothetical protein